MKILLATYWGLPHIGGVDLYVRQLKNGLERRGHKVDILCRLPDGSGYSLLNKYKVVLRSAIYPIVEAKVKGYFEDYFPALDPLIQDMEMERYAYELGAAYFDVSSYDLIHAQDIISAKALHRIKKPDTALVTTIHGYWAGEWFLSLQEQRLLDDPVRKQRLWQYAGFREQSGLNPSNAATLPTNWMRDIMSNDFAVPLEKLTVVPNGIDIGEFMKRMNAKTTFRAPADKKVIICSARLDSIKGHKYLIRALARLKQDRDDWICLLVGNGGLEFNLRELVKVHGIEENVLFMGLRGDVPALLSHSHIFVLPSLQDNHPYAVMEAQVAGNAVIVSDAGGMPEMVNHGVTGLVFEKCNDEQLYQHLRTYMSDEQFRHYVSEEAKSFGNRHWSLELMMERMSNVYETALARNRGGVRV